MDPPSFTQKLADIHTMRFFLRFILILIFAYPAGYLLPWWGMALIAFAVGAVLSERRKRRVFAKKQPPARSFLAGFLAIFLLWGSIAFYHNLQNANFLAEKISQLFTQSPPIPGPYLLILITALIGGILGGLSALSGNFFGEALKGVGR